MNRTTQAFVAMGILGITLLGHAGTLLAQEESTTEWPFTDVEETNRYRTAIEFLYDEGIVQGYDDGTFRPYDSINRAEALKLVLMSFETLESTSGENETETISFNDVPEDAWHYSYIQQATEKGITKGYDDGNFYPERSINRVEALKLVIKSAGIFDEPYVHPTLDADPANDVPKDSWFADYVDYALDNGITYLDAEGNLNPDTTITRGEMADLIYRVKNPGIFSGSVEFGEATYYGKSWDGVNTASGETLYQSDYVAAHKTLPFGTLVRVTNLSNLKTVTVEIIDRGPYGEGRIIDLSYSAFEAIEWPGAGIAQVEIEIVNPTSL